MLDSSIFFCFCIYLEFIILDGNFLFFSFILSYLSLEDRECVCFVYMEFLVFSIVFRIK